MTTDTPPAIVVGWWFSREAELPNGDGRAVIVGETLTVDAAKVVPCKYGLHASPLALDALQYAPGSLLWRVELGGRIVSHGDPIDKYAASERKIIAGGIDVSPMLREFARWCALQVIDLWDAPPIVKEYLQTGDEHMRAAAAAWAAAWDAARAAAGAAAWDAARAAAWAAARAAAWAAAGAAARAAARAAAWAAAGTQPGPQPGTQPGPQPGTRSALTSRSCASPLSR